MYTHGSIGGSKYIGSMAREVRSGQTDRSLVVVFFRVLRTETGLLSGQTAVAMWEILQRTKLVDLALTFGATSVDTKEPGQITRWKVEAFSPGPTAKSMKVST